MLWQRIKEQKGFTLVELMVVLVILGIVGSFAVPALTGYIDDTKEKKAVTETQACVTAATGAAAEERAKAVNAAFRENSDSFTTEFTKWAGTLTDSPVAVTGDLTLTEGDGQYYLKPVYDSSKSYFSQFSTIINKADVTGSIDLLQFNADGKVLCLVYTSADGITVAYSAGGSAGSPDTTIPVATIPAPTTTPTTSPTTSPDNTATPTPTPEDHDGDLIFCVLDEYTGKPISGIKFKIVRGNADSSDEFKSEQTTDSSGKVYYPMTRADLNDYYKSYTLVPIDWPDGVGEISTVTFGLSRYPQNDPTDFNIQSIEMNNNTAAFGYQEGFTHKNNDTDKYNHVYTFYVRHTPTVQFRVVDENNLPVNGVHFTVVRGTQILTINDSSKTQTFYAKIHAGDKVTSDATQYLDLSVNSTDYTHTITFTQFPQDYQYFDNFNMSIYPSNQGGKPQEIYSYFQPAQWSDSLGRRIRTDVTCESGKGTTIITLHITQVMDITFHKYSKDDLDLDVIPELTGAKLQLYKADSNNSYSNLISEWTTEAAPKTLTLQSGAYCLKEVETPADFNTAEDIYFTLTPVDGKLKLEGVTTSKEFVDVENSSITMVDTPTVKSVGIQIIDKSTGLPWTGVNAVITGDLGNRDDQDRNWSVNNLNETIHTFKLPLKAGDYTVTVTDNNNFVKSEYKFSIKKVGDQFIIISGNDSSSADGAVNGNTVTVYAYVKVNVSFKNDSGNISELKNGKLIIKASPDLDAYTVNGKKITEWNMQDSWQNHKVGLSTGDYFLKESTRPNKNYPFADLTPVEFHIKRTDGGAPQVWNQYGPISNTIEARYYYKW